MNESQKVFVGFFSPSLRVKPAIFDLLLAVCIAAYLGVMYLSIQVSRCVHAGFSGLIQTCTTLYTCQVLHVKSNI